MNRRTLIKILSGLSVLPVMPGVSLASSAHRRVILLELSGANDGLNTVVPFKDNRYHKLRPTLGLKAKNVISLDDYFAFNDSLKDAMPLWEKDEMAVVHGLGYPNPNRSHFKSIELWETGSDGNKVLPNGWMTHDLEHSYAVSKIDAHGISLGGGMGIFTSGNGNWLSMTTAEQFSDRAVALTQNSSGQNSNGQKNNGKHNAMMDLLFERARTLNSSIDQIAKKVEQNKHRVKVVGAGEFSAQIATAINLINAGVNVPVLKVTLNGFDTHENQAGRHNRLLRQLATGVSQLRSELSKTDNWNNTIVLTYSEFGRRAAENRSNGTDHGTASAHFVFGGNINGGFHGQHPDLGQLLKDDLQYTMDYRALYSSVLSDWLATPTNQFKDYKSRALNNLFS